MNTYHDFLQSKRTIAQTAGIEVALDDIHSTLFDWQKVIVQWALRRGRAALFCECGTGKSFMQIVWADIIHRYTGRDLLILAPLAVAKQTVTEGAKLGITVTPCRSQSDVRTGISIANYEMLEHFDTAHFVGVVLDESSLLKSFMGKTKRALVESFASTPYKLACTATPAPNDHMELGNHAEFLGIMPSTEMLMRWFINDTMQNGHYRLKGHAERDFWAWVASWAISLRRPSDIGYSNEGFVLPELRIERRYVETDLTVGVEEGQLFRLPIMSATTLHKEKRLTVSARAQAVADLVNSSQDTFVVWCNTNYEADELIPLILDAVEVRGSESIAEKERKLLAFTNGETRTIICKPSMFGYGLNWQHCHRMVFAGLDYSFENFYQAIRRCYRFGQTRPVEVAIIAANTEAPLITAIERKVRDHQRMSDSMTNTALLSLREKLTLSAYDPHIPMILPSWLHERNFA